MSKILFIMKYPLVDPYAVKVKFNGQLNAAKSLGHDVWYVAFDHEAFYLMHNDEKTKIKDISFGESKHYIHTKAFWDMFDSVSKVLNDEHFDIAYMRDCPLDISGVIMCKKLVKSGCKLVVEIPTFPPECERMPTLIKRLYMKYSAFCWSMIQKHIVLYVLIGEKAHEYKGVRAINIDNGIDVDMVPIRNVRFDRGKYNLLAVASMSSWQGYDRLIRGISNLDECMRNKVVFHLVGPEGDGSLSKWKALADSLRVSEQVVLYGAKTGQELDEIFNMADIGIATLGMHRKNMTIGSVLKIREYTSRGLPFVYATDDPAIEGKLDFCYKVSENESPIDLSEVISFAEKMRKRGDIPITMREYARNKMSWVPQMRYVFDTVERMNGGYKGSRRICENDK